jgi:hypothetical protein
VSAVIIPFAPRQSRESPRVVSSETIEACGQLLDLAEAGDLSGFAIIGVKPGDGGGLWFDTIGLSAKDAERCLLPLGRLLHRLDGMSRDSGGLSS